MKWWKKYPAPYLSKSTIKKTSAQDKKKSLTQEKRHVQKNILKISK